MQAADVIILIPKTIETRPNSCARCNLSNDLYVLEWSYRGRAQTNRFRHNADACSLPKLILLFFGFRRM
jgi:hypothetical protein